VSLVQGFPSKHTTGVSVQVPLRGLQLAITHELVGTQSGEDIQPYLGSQVSFTVHKLLSVQLTGGYIHVPFVELQRLRVQILKSSQGFGGYTHWPVYGLQRSRVQLFPSLQFFQTVVHEQFNPYWNVFEVQALPSQQLGVLSTSNFSSIGLHFL
jgi:hypothetical protein